MRLCDGHAGTRGPQGCLRRHQRHSTLSPTNPLHLGHKQQCAARPSVSKPGTQRWSWTTSSCCFPGGEKAVLVLSSVSRQIQPPSLPGSPLVLRQAPRPALARPTFRSWVSALHGSSENPEGGPALMERVRWSRSGASDSGVVNDTPCVPHVQPGWTASARSGPRPHPQPTESDSPVWGQECVSQAPQGPRHSPRSPHPGKGTWGIWGEATSPS